MIGAKQSADLDDLPQGTALLRGRFSLIGRLGRGGTAAVYRTHDAELGREVALKIITTAQVSSELRARNEARFKNEMRFASALGEHPHIARPLELGRIPELDNRLYMTQELVQGPALDQLLFGGGLEPLRACKLIRDVATALCDLHEQGIIHRDVKSSNVLVDQSGEHERALLTDFGYAFSLSDDLASIDRGLTLTHERPGTKHYMAPEQALGHPPAPSFDVYALAITLFEALTGHVPDHTLAPNDVVRRKCSEDEPEYSLMGAGLDLPLMLKAAVDMGLRRHPVRRTESVRKFRDELDGVILKLEARERPSASAGAIDCVPTNVSDDDERAPTALIPRAEVTAAMPTTAPLSGAELAGEPQVDPAPSITRPFLPLDETRDETRTDIPRVRPHVERTEPAVPRPVAVVPARQWNGDDRFEVVDTSRRWIAIGALVVLALVAAIAAFLIHAPAQDGAASASEPSEGETRRPRRSEPPEPSESPQRTFQEPPARPPAPRGKVGPLQNPAASGPPTPRAEHPKRKPSAPPQNPEPAAKPTPAHESEACKAHVEKAIAARIAGDWERILQLLERRDCWARRDDRQALRIEALLGAGRYDECVAAANEYTPPAARRFATRCEQKAGGVSQP